METKIGESGEERNRGRRSTDDHYTSSYFYTTNTVYTFSNLSSGNYVFFFVAVCSGEESGYIGIEDQILN